MMVDRRASIPKPLALVHLYCTSLVCVCHVTKGFVRDDQRLVFSNEDRPSSYGTHCFIYQPYGYHTI